MKKITMFLAAMLFVFAVVPAGNVKAAQVSRTGKQTETVLLDEAINQLKDAKINQLGEGKYAGGYVTGLKQTSATTNSVTISWSPASGATGYLILDNNKQLADVRSTSYTVQLPEGTVDYLIGVVPYDANYYSMDHLAATYISTKPKKVTGIKYNGVFASSNKLSVVWNDNACIGFEAYCYNKSGKLVQSLDEDYYRSVTFSKTNTQNIYSVKVKPYVYINGKEKLYGDMSGTFYAVPQPKITSKNSDVKLNSVKLKWKKVKGATKYVIYCSTKPTSGYKKVATVKSSKNSYTVRKFKGKTLNTKSKKYFRIVTYGKFGKKTVKSQSKAYLSAKTTVYYR
ncbi:MAG: hypothetical protein NC347_13170 [Clostridium sp.]|nr:hypothetical protein [Clostridium sp.]